MEIKDWSYEEFPAFTEEVEGAKVLLTTGDETAVHYVPDVEYESEGGVKLRLQILMPFSRNQPKRTLPCVAFVQGSAWKEQDIYKIVPRLSGLAKRGYTAACVEYRHSGIAPFPAQAVDARNAVRFLKCHAAEYGIDPERVVIAGDSSGGHTAVFAGMMHDDDTEQNRYPGVSGDVRCIVNYYGAVTAMLPDGNPNTLNYHLPDSPEGMEMGGVNLLEHPELCRKMSAECNIFEDTVIPPMLIFHGTKDRTVNARQSVLLYRRLRECKKEAELYFLEGADHGGAEFWTEEVLGVVDRFIRKYI